MTSVKKQQVRIIAGHWRGTRLTVPEVDGLRPTPDRIRETLFNWIAPHCPGATVLDAFAGSGALGFEALSRQASRLVLIEKNSTALKNLQQQAQRLRTDRVITLAGDALTLLPGLNERFELVFIDPPYAFAGLRRQLLLGLIENHRLVEGAIIYLEWPRGESFELPHPCLVWLRRKTAGAVNYAIAEWKLNR